MKNWIQAARLRTLPLSVSGIVLGSFYAISQNTFDWKILVFALITTLGFQVLSNFANDYGDGIKGTDNQDRVGPKRAIQSGAITPNEMKKAMIITSILTIIAAVILIYLAFGKENLLYSLLFFAFGLGAIVAAIRYTVGNSAYGYKGFGDVFVFLFFGLVSTLGVNFLYTKQLDLVLILPAIAIGFLSVGVLNLNNMRDEVSDKKSNKNTLVVKMGVAWAKKYHYFLVITAMFMMLYFALLKRFRLEQYAFVVAYFALIGHLLFVYRNDEPRDLDPELKKLAISTFVLSLLISLCLLF